jgi:hypothetical protein
MLFSYVVLLKMKKGVIALGFFLSLLLLFPIISANSVGSELQRVTHYAEEYETGNINYVQLLVYLGSVRESLNELLGATGREYGGILQEEQIRQVLGEPEHYTKWVWVAGEDHDTRMDRSVPEWRKIVFDGKKIQIRLSAHPSVFNKDGELILFYSFHFEVEFKKPEEQLDIQSKIDYIKGLAEEFNSNPTQSNAEVLAKESVNAEKIFESHFRERGEMCEETMKDIFGAENRRGDQKTIVQEIDFFSGEKFDAIMRLEMCDECEWHWINMHMWLEGRGRFKGPEDVRSGEEQRHRYRNMNFEEFEAETAELLDEIKRLLAQGDHSQAISYSNRLMLLNEEWNNLANNVWEEVDELFRAREEEMHQMREQNQQPFDWHEFENERKETEENIREQNYQRRKAFYERLFESYEKREYFFQSIEFEKRLIEEFREFGEEICHNFEDDNDNDAIDCADDQCAGKVCGTMEGAVVVNNQTTIQEVNLYCISGICQVREEEVPDEEVAICGNHICEDGEVGTCSEDCAVCPEHPPIECAGDVIFSGEDENGCPLQPVCIEEEEFCEVDEDCHQPLCGVASCIEGTCQTTDLAQCQETECVDGQKKIKQCDSGEEIVAKVCYDGVWKDTEVACREETGGLNCKPCGNGCLPLEDIMVASCLPTTEEFDCVEENGACVVSHLEVEEETESGNECVTRNDCGGQNDVCSNGWCTTLPEVIHVEEPEHPEVVEETEEGVQEETGEEPVEEVPEETSEPEVEEPEVEETPEEPEETQEESNEEPATASIILGLFKSITGNFLAVSAQEENTGEDTTSEDPEETTTEEPPQEEPTPPEEPPEDIPEEPPEEPSDCPDAGEPPQLEENCWHKKTFDERGCVSGYDVECGEWEEGERGEGEEHKEPQRICEENCRDGCSEDDRECVEDCIEECWGSFEGGEPMMMEGEEEIHLEEKGVFAVGGVCRSSQQQTDAFIWFNGWGEPFEMIQPLKNKYYMGGEADWCKWDMENLGKIRAEMEAGFNQEFIEWFFEDYLANNAEEWEQHASGIYDLYWRMVDNQWQTAERMRCLDLDEIPYNYNLISLSYDSPYGSVEYWEEVKTVKLPGMDEEVTIISPYMKIWIFPTKEFIKYEMQEAMRNHEFPGPPEEKIEREREEGPTDEEKDLLRQDEDFMNKLRDAVENYGGNIDVVVQFKDYETEEIVFNLYVQINEEDIIKMEPMLPEEVPGEDIRIEVDFDRIYELIYDMETDMRGEEIESPPWDRKIQPVKRIKDVANGIMMYFKIRSIMNSAKIYPEEATDDAEDLFKTFFKMMMEGDREGEEEGGEDKSPETWEDKEILTGEAILN